MKILSAIAAASLAVSMSAQSITLAVDPAGVGLTYTNPGANFFDIDVTNPAGITLQALTVALNSPAGTTGTLEVWMTSTTHIGKEQAQNNWTKISEGSTTAGTATLSCQEAETITAGIPSIFLPAGTYGIAVLHVGVNHVFETIVTYPLPAFTDANIAVRNGTTQATAWASVPLTNFSFGGVNYAGTLMQFDLVYAAGQAPHACAVCGTVGEGSNRHSASAYQLFGEPAPNTVANTALEGNVLSFLPNGSGTGYIMTNGTGTVSYVAPNGQETNLPPADDQAVPVSLLIPLQYPGDLGIQLTNDIEINSNGHVSVGPNPQSGIAAAPTAPQAIMQSDQAAWFAAHNFDNSEAGSGNISYWEDTANAILYVTWDAVECVPATLANTCTIQFQFDLAGGSVHIIFEAIDAVGGSTTSGGDNFMIGWSPAGVSPRVEEFDFTTLLSGPILLTQPEILPLTLAAVGTPLIGQSFDLTTSNAPTISIGINVLSASLLPVPLDLVAFGGPAGTPLYMDPANSFLNTISNIAGLGSMTLTLPVSNVPALAGFEINSQSFWLDLAGAPFPFQNIIGSNLVTCTIGNF
ncbi:MAG: hypothetical protein ACI89X_004071 [Planctomycetota bacterium]|jgi:hypothetical protein